MKKLQLVLLAIVSLFVLAGCHGDKQYDDLLQQADYNRENDLYKFSKRNVHFSPFFRGSSSSLEYHLKGF